ncbi:hypothetical protein J7E70_07740 [Variovorax paradoxus]|nr:hypothetical protein [Variovorax paradoxus]MBT2300354.1 hypothetical protein [Variovorax paradoxus]
MTELKRRFYEWLDTKLIPEWDKAWRMLSVQWTAVMGVATTMWLAVPDSDRSAFASMLGINPGYLLLAGMAVNIYLRLKPQPKLHE